MPTQSLSTLRLILRRWREDDLTPYAAMTADPVGMKHLGGVKSLAEATDKATQYNSHFAEYGYGFWVVEVPGVTHFAGIVGLKRGDFEIPEIPSPWIEIGWQLVHDQWGHGYATEAAQAALNHGFREHHIPEIIAFTSVDNKRSRRVMDRLGMTYDSKADFDYPKLAADDPTRRRVVYKVHSPDH